MSLRLGLAISAATLAGGCAPHGGAKLLDVATELWAPRGFSLTKPAAIETAKGTRFRGSICRRSGSAYPHQIRLERLAASGDVQATATRALPSLAYRGQPCALYEVATPWRLTPADRIRVCAVSSDRSCPLAP